MANVHKKTVLCFDTEQSESDQQSNIKGVLKRIGISETPEHYQCYNLRQIDFVEYKKFTSKVCDLCETKFNGIHLLFIDGGADYLADINEGSESKEMVQYFIHLSIKHNCPVIIIIHQNPGGTKERGHFGSEGQRKCFGLVSIEKDGDISTVSPKLMRKAGNGDMPLINFKFDKEKGYHVETDIESKEISTDKLHYIKIKGIAEKAFPPPVSVKHNEAVHKIMEVSLKKESMSKNYLKDMVGFGFLKKDFDGFYRLNIDKDNLGQNGSIDVEG